MHVQSYNIQNPGLFKTRGIFKSLSNIEDHAYSEPWHSQSRLFKYFQGCLGMFRDIDAYSAALTGMQLGRRGEVSAAHFEKKKVLILEKMALIMSIILLNFLFKIKL